MRTETASDAAKSEVAQAVKRIVREFDPEAEVILYGSRARGDAEPDSDWDFLVLTGEALTFEEEEALHARLYPLQVENDAVFSLIVEPKSRWGSGPMTRALFHENVEREGCLV